MRNEFLLSQILKLWRFVHSPGSLFIAYTDRGPLLSRFSSGMSLMQGKELKRMQPISFPQRTKSIRHVALLHHRSRPKGHKKRLKLLNATVRAQTAASECNLSFVEDCADAGKDSCSEVGGHHTEHSASDLSRFCKVAHKVK